MNNIKTIYVISGTMAKFIVTNNNDSGIGSLRQAILDANQLEGADTIEVSGNITLTSAINITDSVSIVSVGKTTITQTGNDRLFYINDGDADSLSEVKFRGIKMTGGNTAGSGGAIFSQENLGIFGSNLLNNTAGDRGGAVYVEGAALRVNGSNLFKNTAGTGGAIALAFDSQANITSSRISGNTATADGGGISVSYGSKLQISNSKVSGNTANNGGAISAYYDSSAKLAKTTVSGNTAQQAGGGIASAYYSDVEVVRSTISGNTAKISGGIDLASSTLLSSGNEITGNTADDNGGIGISYYSQANIFDSIISGNAAKFNAGGINAIYGSKLNLDNSLVTDNVAGKFGGGINADLGSRLEITSSAINDNQAKASGGINLTEASSLSLVDSQVSGNQATKFQGGGIGISDFSTAEISASIISENTSQQSKGGGISVVRDSNLKVDNAVIADNTAAESGGGVDANNSSQVEVTDSIIVINQARIGGGINAANKSFLSLTDTVVADNAATDFGGGINALFNSKVEIERGTVTGNTASVVGGINIANGSSGKLANSSVDNNVAETSGGGINVYSDSQLEVFDSSITNNTNGGLQAYENSTVTLISSRVTDNTLSNISGDGVTEVTTQIIEAEAIADLAGYRLESNSQASGGQLLSLVGENSNEVGAANFNFNGASGNYTVKIGTYDENDGAATIKLAQQGDVVGSIILDENSGSSGIADDTKVTKVIAANISINQGDRFTLTGFEDGGEHARIDFIEFEAVNENGEGATSNPVDTTPTTPTTPTTNPDPTPTDVIRWEAENADSLTGYRTERIAGASGDTVLSLLGEAFGETGSASFTVGNSGTYDILLATYDENDGAASFDVELNGSQIGDTLVLNNDLGSNVANAQTAVSEIVAFGVSLEAGDILTVNGLEQDSEHARLDYVELLATEEAAF